MALMSSGIYYCPYLPSMLTASGCIDEVGEMLEEDTIAFYWVKLNIGYAVNYVVEAWTTETFGPRGTWTLKGDERWLASDGKYYFAHEQDRTLFLMKWS